MYSSILLLIVLYVAARYYLYVVHKSKYWCWDDGKDQFQFKRQKIATDKIHFPRGFLWGTASAAHQIEGGHTNNNWAEWETRTNEKGESTIKHGDKCGDACDHWNRVEEDIGLMKELGCNAYRFSLSWDKLEPEEGQWDQAAIQHYHDELDALARAGIVPMITLHHFTQPLWFDRRGGFTTETGIDLFVRFSMKCFELYGAKCQLWCTINEPEVYVAGGWFSGLFPPGKKDLSEGAIVLRNLLEAHVRVYYAIKQMRGGETAQIGIVKDIFQFEPWNPLNPLDRFMASTLDHSFNGCILDFFKTGKFYFSMAGVKIQHVNLKAVRANDFIGLNYYSHHHVKFQLPLNGRPPFVLLHKPGVLMTDMPYPVYPEGFYRALLTINELHVPIYVTENGIADTYDDRRHLWLRRYLYAMSRAIQDGCDIRGYFYWSLVDNFEWAEGWSMKFGLYELDPVTQKRTLRDGSKYFQRVIQEHSK